MGRKIGAHSTSLRYDKARTGRALSMFLAALISKSESRVVRAAMGNPTLFVYSKIYQSRAWYAHWNTFQMDLHEALWSPITLKPPYLLDFRHKKRRPWTSLDDEVVEPGGLNNRT